MYYGPDDVQWSTLELDEGTDVLLMADAEASRQLRAADALVRERAAVEVFFPESESVEAGGGRSCSDATISSGAEIREMRSSRHFLAFYL